jgi:hypothetical protein
MPIGVTLVFAMSTLTTNVIEGVIDRHLRRHHLSTFGICKRVQTKNAGASMI